jgi:Sulfotransferase family
MKVLYILGSSRSGSTILANTLGEVDGFFSAGELRFLWERALQERRCSCGERVQDCAIWGRVLDAPSGAAGPYAWRQVVGWQRRAVRLSQTPSLLAGRSTIRSQPLNRYLDTLSRSFRVLREVTGAQLIIDSSKGPSDGAALRLLPDIETFFLHIVRDPRGVAFSRQQRKQNPDREGGEMPRSSTVNSIVHWSARNLASDLVRWRAADRSLLLRYEDFVSRPVDALRAIGRLVREPLDPTALLCGTTLMLGPNHMASGNPDRFVTGEVELRSDERWRKLMSRHDRLRVEALTFPMMIRYGYRLGAGSTTSTAIE